MKVHVVSESAFIMKATGVHSAFLEHVELLKEKNDIDVVVNNEGIGDVFHCHTYGPYYFWKGRKYSGRRIFTAHVIPDSIKGSFPMWKVFMPFAKWYLKKVFSYADVCIAISPMVEQAIKELKVDTRTIKIYNPIPLEMWKFTPERRMKGRALLNISDTDFVVLGSGQLEGRKGVDTYIDVAEKIPEAKFTWVGGRPFGPLTEGIIRINERIRKAPKNVKFKGAVEFSDMPYMYAAADMLLFPSFQENCPLAPLEAAACGIPVVFRDIVEYTTLFVNPYLKACTKQGFIELVKKLIHDKEFYMESKNISKQLITQFDKNKIREQLIGLYQELMTGSFNYPD